MISVSALLTLVTVGQHCGYGYGYGYQNYTYVYPSYVQPTYYYQPVVYAQPTYQVKTKVVAVEHYNDEYADLAGTYERAERRAEAKLKEKLEIEKKFDTLTQAIERLTVVQQQPVVQQQTTVAPQATVPAPSYATPQQPTAAPQAPVYIQPTPAPMPQPQQAAPPSKSYPSTPSKSSGYGPSALSLDYSAPSPPPARPVSLDSRGSIPVVLNRCAACHTGAASQGGFVMFDAPGQVANLTNEDFQLADEAVASGRMPKGGPPLSLAEYREFGNWIRSISTSNPGPVANNLTVRNPF